MRCAQRPTSRGSGPVHALGSMVSSVEAKPMMMLRPVTDAVMEPSVAAASAVVERCPIETTEATTSEYSSTCVPARSRYQRVGRARRGAARARGAPRMGSV
jgi:hypothetical protein